MLEKPGGKFKQARKRGEYGEKRANETELFP
jgi:hypothetical protein